MKRRTAALCALLTTAALLSACGSSDSTATPDADTSSGAFPVTIENTFGSATIESKPQRIVTLGGEDAVYALGEKPVGQLRITYGNTEAGVYPWNESYFDSSVTTLLDNTTSLPYEAIAALNPDVILAPYQGFDDTAYETLSAIAPTVAYPDKPWQTTWQDQTLIVGKALGKTDEAAAAVAESQKAITDTAAAHPEFAGKSASVVSFYGGALAAYLPGDPRVTLTEELGFTTPTGIEELAATKDDFYIDVAPELIGKVDADVILAYDDGTTYASTPSIAGLGAVQRGSVAKFDDTQLIAGLGLPTVLSIPWALDRTVPTLAAAAA
ncbi:iron-siderophore ABC transporter substrate-binding protein [Actinomycetes bacterium M1A6_2h]